MSDTEPKEDFSAYLGRDVGSYHLGQLIGSGGMGAVFLATHNILKKRVALKLLREQHRQDKETARGFFAEAKAAAGTGHENVIQVFDVDEDPVFGPFMVMEYLSSSESLAAVIRREGALSFSRVRKITVQIAGALSATHARGVVHCDLKPSNILLIHAHGQADVVKLIDFGIAKTINSANQPSQGPKIVRGTPKYMSPEQVAGKALDGRSDEYSLGILAYLMIAGVSPFSTGSPAETMRKQYYDPPPPIRERRKDLPEAAEAVLLRALSKKPDARYPEILDFAHALADALPPETKKQEKMLPPLMIEEFSSKDHEMFDGPSLIHLQPIASPSETTGDVGAIRRTLPRMGIVQPPPYDLPDSLGPVSSPLRHPDDPSGSMPKLPPLFAEPAPAPVFGSILDTPKASGVMSAASILSNEPTESPSSLYPPLLSMAPVTSLPPLYPPEAAPRAATPLLKAPEPPTAAPEPNPQDILNLGRSWSSLPIVKEESASPLEAASGSYQLPPLEPTNAAPLLGPSQPRNDKAEALHRPRRRSDDDEGSSALYWLSFFLIAGCFGGWFYLSGFFGGFILAQPASSPPAPLSAPATPKPKAKAKAKDASTEPASKPTKPPKKKKTPAP